MQVFEFGTWDELAPYAEPWDRLAAGVPFRSWTWLSHWWRHYGRTRRTRLLVLGVFDQADLLVGAAPGTWILRPAGPRDPLAGLGRSLLRLRRHPLPAGRAVRRSWKALADYLAETEAGRRRTGLGPAGTGRRRRGRPGRRRFDPPAWPSVATRSTGARRRVAGGSSLPATWDEYLAGLSKGHRKQLRRLRARLVRHRPGGARIRSSGCDELPAAAALLDRPAPAAAAVAGPSGLFRLAALRRLSPRSHAGLLREGHLQLHWLELDGRPVAAEYHLAGGGIVYAYQVGDRAGGAGRTSRGG